jgi:hypothetical protein
MPIVAAWEMTRDSDGLPDAAPRRVGHPREGDDVLRVAEDRQVRDRVLDLRALVELRAADDLVADLAAHERVLEHPRLRVRPVEAGDLRARDALVDEPLDLPHDVPGLRVLVVELADPDLVALADVRPQLLAHPAAVVADDAVRGVQDGLRGAVVLLQADDPGLGELVLEREDVRDVGSAEAVDGVVGDDAARDEVVRALHVQVEDGRVQRDALDALDDIEPAVLAEHRHARPDVGGGGEGQRGAPAGLGSRQAGHAGEGHIEDLADPVGEVQHRARVLRARLEPPGVAPGARRAHGEAEILQRPPSLVVLAEQGQAVHRRAPAAVAAQREGQVPPPPPMGGRPVVGKVRIQPPVGEQPAPAVLAVGRLEDLVDEHLVAHERVRRSRLPRGERQGRQSVAQRDDGFVHPCLGLVGVRPDDPGGVGVLGHGAHRQAQDGLALPAGVQPRRPDAEALVGTPHHVARVQVGRRPHPVAREVDVLGGRDDPAAAAQRDGDAVRAAHRPERPRHASGPEVADPWQDRTSSP